MRFKPEQYRGPDYSPYFTLKYVAGYRAVGGHRSPAEPPFPCPEAWEDADARSGIDALLSVPSPELELWRECQEIEAKLFGVGRQYTLFL
ncbi:MAG: hypothetical protein IT365_29435 [Candidatus Hydrogenedentes bacterium]|nr:hypothetical protein [Candidatus Hydrogenedentota bacterium]